MPCTLVSGNAALLLGRGGAYTLAGERVSGGAWGGSPGRGALKHGAGVIGDLVSHERQGIVRRSPLEFHATADQTAGIGDEIGDRNHRAVVQGLLGSFGDGDVGALHDNFGIEAVDIGVGYDVGSRGRHPDVARKANNIVTVDRAGCEIFDQAPVTGVRDERGKIDARGLIQGGGNICDADQDSATARQELSRVHTDRAKALHRDPCAREIEPDMIGRDLGRGGNTEASGANFVEGNAALISGKTDGAPRLFLEPYHAGFVGAHIGARDIFIKTGDRPPEGTDEAFFLRPRHERIGRDDRLAAAMWQIRCRGLEGHGTGETKGLFRSHIGRHPDAADSGPQSDVVDGDDRLEADRWVMEMDNELGAEIIGELEKIGHNTLR